MSEHLDVLVVDDSEDDAFLLLRELRRGGYEVQHRRVDTSDDMRSALDEKTWDLIFCDYCMPEFNGIQALALCRAIGVKVPVIMFSGKIEEDIAIAAIAAGAADYIFKDKPKRVIPSVRRVLRDKRVHEDMLKLRRKLSDSRSILRTFADDFGGLVEIKDREGRYLAVNKAFEQALGLPSDAILGRTAAEIFNGAKTGPWIENDQLAFAEKQCIESVEQVVLDGEIRNYTCRRQPIANEHGDTFAICCISTDVTGDGVDRVPGEDPQEPN